jgi:hypothetical protein
LTDAVTGDKRVYRRIPDESKNMLAGL